MDYNDRVKASLFNFLKTHLKSFKEEEIDEIILSYVVNLLEVISSSIEDDHDSFDVDEFTEMMAAYLPETSSVARDLMVGWLFEMANEQRRLQSDKASKLDFDLRSVIEETSKKVTAVTLRTPRVSESSDGFEEKKRSAKISENSDGSSDSGVDVDEVQPKVEQLLEMFPNSCSIEVTHCLKMALGDLEEAAQLIICREETGQNLKQVQRKSNKSAHAEVDEKVLRQRIVHSYGFVDKDDDARYHRPTVWKKDDKKMIRYRDGKIVSTKGERFTQVTKEESEELKKSYVS